MQRAKSLADQLAALNSPVSEEDLIERVLYGLDDACLSEPLLGPLRHV